MNKQPLSMQKWALVWGIGRRMTAHMQALGIHTAMDLAKADPFLLCRKFSVVLEKTVRELAGTSCLALEDAAPAKQEICCSRMFGVRLEKIELIKEVVATYAQHASEKLRAQYSLCKKIRVSIRKHGQAVRLRLSVFWRGRRWRRVWLFHLRLERIVCR